MKQHVASLQLHCWNCSMGLSRNYQWQKRILVKYSRRIIFLILFFGLGVESHQSSWQKPLLMNSEEKIHSHTLIHAHAHTNTHIYVCRCTHTCTQTATAVMSNSQSHSLSCLLTSFFILLGCQENKADIKWTKLSHWIFRATAEGTEGELGWISERKRWKGKRGWRNAGKSRRRAGEEKQLSCERYHEISSCPARIHTEEQKRNNWEIAQNRFPQTRSNICLTFFIPCPDVTDDEFYWCDWLCCIDCATVWMN